MVLLIFKSKLRTKQQIIIFLILFSLFFCVADRVINIYSDFFSKQFPGSIFILDTFNLAYLPLIYLFVKDISARFLKLTWLDLIHFAPFLFNFFLVLFAYTIKPASEQLIIQRSFVKPGFFYNGRLIFYIIDYLRIFQIVYVIVSIFMLRRFQNSLRDFTAQKSFISNMLMIILISFVVLWIINLVFNSWFGRNHLPFIDILIVSTSALFIYFGFKLPKEFIKNEYLINPAKEIKVKDFEIFRQKLENHIQSKKSFLDPEITLAKLSELTGIANRSLSETINNCYKMHFFDFINSLRINEAKILLKESDKTVLEILYMSGFNSKSAFNRAFIKQEGVSPTQFRKENHH